MRYRLYRNGKYVFTGYTKGQTSTESETLAYILNQGGIQLGDIIYAHEFFWEAVEPPAQVEGTKVLFSRLTSTDPKVQGLYGQAYRAEQLAAQRESVCVLCYQAIRLNEPSVTGPVADILQSEEVAHKGCYDHTYHNTYSSS